jgi:hypothetical protein
MNAVDAAHPLRPEEISDDEPAARPGEPERPAEDEVDEEAHPALPHKPTATPMRPRTYRSGRGAMHASRVAWTPPHIAVKSVWRVRCQKWRSITRSSAEMMRSTSRRSW